MDDIAASLSRLNINVIDSPCRLPETSYNDNIITCVQEKQLIEARLEVKVTPDHEIFLIVEHFCKRWAIPMYAADNFMFLATGNLKFPVLLLQNPSEHHDLLHFEHMVDRCPTLVWLRDVLQDLGLHTDDVVILDVCPLLKDSWLRLVTERQAEEAIKEAYEVIERILVLLRPELLISCQCATRSWSTQLGRYASDFAHELGSSWIGAEQKRIVRLQHRKHIFNIIQAYHPRSFIGRDDSNAYNREILLKEILCHFLRPCGQWKAQVTMLLQLDTMLGSWLEAMKDLKSTTNKLLETMDRLIAELQDSSHAAGVPLAGGRKP